jgi:hypothetical protein
MEKTISQFKLIDNANANKQPLKYCKWCGAPIYELVAPNQKYCAHDVKDCNKKAYNDNVRKRMARYRQRWKGLNIGRRPGTTTLGLNVAKGKDGEPDFEREMRIIRAERNRYLSKNNKYNKFAGAALMLPLWDKNIIGFARWVYLECPCIIAAMVFIVLAGFVIYQIMSKHSNLFVYLLQLTPFF